METYSKQEVLDNIQDLKEKIAYSKDVIVDVKGDLADATTTNERWVCQCDLDEAYLWLYTHKVKLNKFYSELDKINSGKSYDISY